MKKTLLFGWLIAASLLLTSAAASAAPTKRYDPGTQTCRQLNFYNSGWVSRGAEIFESSCKSCHHRGNEQGAPFLHTESKTMKGWNRLFYKKYARCYKNGAWNELSQDDLLKLNDYLYWNASNTYDPYDAENCG